MSPKYSSKKKIVYKRKPKITVRKPKTMVSAVKAIVKNTLSRQVEVKHFGNVEESKQALIPISTTNPGKQIALYNALACFQGTAQGQRVGNRVKLNKFMLRGFIHADPSSTVPSYVRMLIIAPLDGSIGLGNAADLFQNGNISYGPAPNFNDMTARINTDKYKFYYSRLFKVGPSSWSTQGDNDFKNFIQYKVNCMKMFPKIIKYNDAATNPTSVILHPTVVFISLDWDGAANSGISNGTPGNNPFLTFSCEADYTDE